MTDAAHVQEPPVCECGHSWGEHPFPGQRVGPPGDSHLTDGSCQHPLEAGQNPRRCVCKGYRAVSAARVRENVVMDSPDHIAAPGMWSYACKCLRCRWEAWWNEGDNSVIGMPDEPHPDGEFLAWFDEREKWSGRVHPNGD